MLPHGVYLAVELLGGKSHANDQRATDEHATRDAPTSFVVRPQVYRASHRVRHHGPAHPGDNLAIRADTRTRTTTLEGAHISKK